MQAQKSTYDEKKDKKILSDVSNLVGKKST